MKKYISTTILILVFLFGLSLLLYPTVSNYWNSLHQSKAIASYVEQIENLDEDAYARIWEQAEEYNVALAKRGVAWHPSEEEQKAYEECLNITGSGIMGYIEIPCIDCDLPIYHGTEDSVLQTAIGHLDGSSLPVGGGSTHCMLSGHRGLPSARLFTDLDELVPGDLFMLHVLGETLTYEVCEILTVLPYEVESLTIEKGRDLCTLITCTPYGVNTHRLLVRAQRVENQEVATTVRVTADATQIEPSLIAPIVAAPILLMLLVFLLIKSKKRR